MALFRDDAGKTEKPTAGRLSEAANKGQVAISREFTMAVTLLVAVIALTSFGQWLMDTFAELMRRGLDVDLRDHVLDDGTTEGALQEIEMTLGLAAVPLAVVVGVILLATLLSGYGQIGFKLRSEALRLKFERLNPASNLSRLFSLTSVVRTGLSALKLAVLATVLWFVLELRMPQFAAMYANDGFADSVAIIADTAFEILFWIAAIVLLLSLGDVFWQRFDHQEVLKMTKQEVEDERRRNDGDPLIKSRLRRAALEIMRQRMMEAIPKADVVITNPTHFSVALKYDRGRQKAPEVVAKGTDQVALTIRELARQHDVPLMEDPPLARALYRAVKVGQEIPEKFYRAVAAVLSHVYRMREEVA